ncbi:MAG: ABC transporter ATP-binding protein, partial [Mycetocola sp.]
MTPAEQNARISLEHSSASRSPLLEVRDLRVEFEGTGGLIAPVESVSFDVGRGERVAIVGESGSGKSVTAMAILGLTEFTGGSVNPKSSIRFDGREVLLMNETERRGIRGGGIAMIFQDPLTSLNPLHSVGAQVAEAVRLHNPGVSTSAAAARSRELFELVQLPRAATLTRSHPHELSGGMRQRVMIAMALAGNPKLLLADEPTTALDVTVQAGILDLLRDIGEERDLSVLMITHDLSVVAGFADRILVMYGGRIVEEGLTEPIFRKPHHPYTHALLGSIPRLDEEPERLIAIEGSPPEPGHRPSGCAFRTRCPYEIDACAEVIPALTLTDSGAAACIRSADIDLSSRRPAQRPPLALRAQEKTSARIILEVRGLSKQYRVRSQTGRRETVNALSGVSFALEEGASLGIIGQSGSGKSTLARCLGALTSPTSGRIIAAGEDIVGANRRTLKSYRRQMQMVFQDPSSSLDQRMRVRDILAEPLRIHGVWRDDPKKSEAQLRS